MSDPWPPYGWEAIPNSATDTEKKIANLYVELRKNCIDLENLLGGIEDQKELDKSITVMKAGFKILKKWLKGRGFSQLTKFAKAA